MKPVAPGHILIVEVCFLCCNISALIPLSEFSEAAVMKKYAVKPDAETLDIANTAARTKSVSCLIPFLVKYNIVIARLVHNIHTKLFATKKKNISIHKK